MDQPTGREAYRACRDILVHHRDDYDAAVAAFRWPDIGDRFNWALDWFDPVAAGNPRTALRIVGADGSDRSYSFAEWPPAPIGSPRRWSPAASRPAIASWSC
jgi:acetyl-CoA synthetase